MVKPRQRREINLVKAKIQSWYTQVTTDFLTLLDTEQIQQYITKIHVCDNISSQIQRRRRQKKTKNSFFIQICFQFSDLRVQFRFCNWKSPKLIVSGLTKRATKNCNCFHYGACINPGSSLDPWRWVLKHFTLCYKSWHKPCVPRLAVPPILVMLTRVCEELRCLRLLLLALCQQWFIWSKPAWPCRPYFSIGSKWMGVWLLNCHSLFFLLRPPPAVRVVCAFSEARCRL